METAIESIKLIYLLIHIKITEMKKLIFTVLMISFATFSFAQEKTASAEKKNWTLKGNIGLNLSQSSFTNWAAGGQSTINWLGTFGYSANYAKDKFKWDNTIAAALGYSYFNFKQQPIKTDDRIELTSLAGLKASDKLLYSLEFALRSQFANGFNYTKDSTHYISKFFAPAYISLGAGIQWVPNEHFSLNFAPATARVTIVNDRRLADEGAFGVMPGHINPNDTVHFVPGEMVRFEFGARATAIYKVDLFENVSFNSKLELFSNYLEHPERIDVDWQNLLVMKVNSWLNCNLSTHLIYDYDIPFYDIDAQGNRVLDPNSKVQFKEVFSLGFMINL